MGTPIYAWRSAFSALAAIFVLAKAAQTGTTHENWSLTATDGSAAMNNDEISTIDPIFNNATSDEAEVRATSETTVIGRTVRILEEQAFENITGGSTGRQMEQENFRPVTEKITTIDGTASSKESASEKYSSDDEEPSTSEKNEGSSEKAGENSVDDRTEQTFYPNTEDSFTNAGTASKEHTSGKNTVIIDEEKSTSSKFEVSSSAPEMSEGNTEKVAENSVDNRTEQIFSANTAEDFAIDGTASKEYSSGKNTIIDEEISTPSKRVVSSSAPETSEGINTEKVVVVEDQSVHILRPDTGKREEHAGDGHVTSVSGSYTNSETKSTRNTETPKPFRENTEEQTSETENTNEYQWDRKTRETSFGNFFPAMEKRSSVVEEPINAKIEPSIVSERLVGLSASSDSGIPSRISERIRATTPITYTGVSSENYGKTSTENNRGLSSGNIKTATSPFPTAFTSPSSDTFERNNRKVSDVKTAENYHAIKISLENLTASLQEIKNITQNLKPVPNPLSAATIVSNLTVEINEYTLKNIMLIEKKIDATALSLQEAQKSIIARIDKLHAMYDKLLESVTENLEVARNASLRQPKIATKSDNSSPIIMLSFVLLQVFTIVMLFVLCFNQQKERLVIETQPTSSKRNTSYRFDPFADEGSSPTNASELSTFNYRL